MVIHLIFVPVGPLSRISFIFPGKVSGWGATLPLPARRGSLPYSSEHLTLSLNVMSRHSNCRAICVMA